MGEIAKKEEPKIGEIRLTEAQKIAIAKLIDTPEWEVFEKWFRMRQTNIATTGITAATDGESLYFYKGMAHESRQTVQMLRKIRNDITQKDVPPVEPKS